MIDFKNIELYFDSSGWIDLPDSHLTCDCCSKKSRGAFYRDEKFKICLPCALGNIKEAGKSILKDSGNRLLIIEENMGRNAGLINRLALILNMDIIRETVIDCKRPLSYVFFNKVLQNIGYSTNHPLSGLLRFITLYQVLKSSDFFIEGTLDLINYYDKSWFISDRFLQYNCAQALAILAPQLPETQRLIRYALELAADKGDSFIINWFTREDNYYRIADSVSIHKKSLEIHISEYQGSGKLKSAIEKGDAHKIIQALERSYTLARLKILFSLYLEGLPVKSFAWPGKKAAKYHYVSFLYEVLTNRDLLDLFMERLPDYIRTALEECLWGEKAILLSTIDYPKDPVPRDRRTSYWNIDYNHIVPDEFTLFEADLIRRYTLEDSDALIYLDGEICKLLRSLLPPPENCSLTRQPSYSTGLTLGSNSDFYSQLMSLAAYKKQVGIKWSKNGHKILKSTIKEVQSLCRISEPYSKDKQLGSLRTGFLVEFYDLILHDLTEPDLDSAELQRHLYDKLFNPEIQSRVHYHHFLKFIKGYIEPGSPSLDIPRIRKEKKAIFTLLNEIDTGEWVSVDNAYRFLNSRNLITPPFDLKKNYRQLYFTTPLMGESGNYGGYDKLMVNESRWGIIREINLKLQLFLLNTMGIIDAAFKYPRNQLYYSDKQPWLSEFEGIEEFTLTPLGSWLLGKTENYNNQPEKKNTLIRLQEKRLLIQVEYPDPVIELTLKMMTGEAGSGYYLVDEDSFLQDCRSRSDIKTKIERFKEIICENPPQIWLDFFDRLLRNAEPLEFAGNDFYLFLLPSDNRELISTLMHDPYLRMKIQKVEDYKILIKQKDYKAVRERLAARGFLISDLKDMGL